MRESGSSTPRALRRRILVTLGLGAAIGGGGFLALFALNARAMDQLFAATDEWVEEQAIADRITQAVMRQLLAVSTMQASGERSLSPEFRSAGDVVQTQLRTFLFRDLSSEERLQLEAIKEAHQRLEVAATRAPEGYFREEGQAGRGSSEAMLTHAYILMDDVSGFLKMREETLQRLRRRHIEVLRITYGAGGAVALILLIGSLALGRFLNRRVAAPLSALTSAADRIGAGDLTVRVPEDFDAEFSALARSFNRMSEGLKVAQSELVEAERLGAMGRMTAGLAHELNNPLASVLGYGELLSLRLTEDQDPRIKEVYGELVAPILEEARRAHDLVASLLRFARRSDPALDAVRVRDPLMVVVAMRAFAFTRAGLILEVGEIPDVHVVAEKQRLQGVFLNLINNALDAMKPAGRGALRIHGGSEEGDLVLRFDDEGPGIDQPELALEPFFTTKTPGEGTGLGLALVREFMEEFGGAVRAENRPGGGAGLVLRFRITDAPAAPPVPQPSNPDLQEGITGVGGGVPRVLVVEDEPHLRALQRRILDRMGARVLLASDAAEARLLLDQHEVDVVVSDVKMPGESGLQFFRWLTLAHPHLADRFLFVTGDTGDPEIISLFEERPELFLRKPFEIEEYTARLALLLRRLPGPDADSPPSSS